MTVPTSARPAASPARLSPAAKKTWTTPALARLDGRNAQNSANPAGPDGGFSSGS